MSRSHGPNGPVSTKRLITSKHGKPPSSLRWSNKRRAENRALKAAGVRK